MSETPTQLLPCSELERLVRLACEGFQEDLSTEQDAEYDALWNTIAAWNTRAPDAERNTLRAELADTNLALSERLKTLADMRARAERAEAELYRVRPKADCYERVCQTLGIERDILGHVGGIKAELAEAQAAVARLQEAVNAAFEAHESGDSQTCWMILLENTDTTLKEQPR